jgi:drug/metabolite transporter (DMT)-like permease
MALLGLVCLVLPGASAPDPLGAVLMGLAGFAWGCFSLLGRGTSDPGGTNAANLMGCLLLAAVASLLAARDFEATPTGVLVAIVSGSIATGLGYVVWYLALRGLRASQAATVQLSMPAIVALGGIALLSEPITLRVFVASLAMLGGIWLVLQRAQRSGR